MPAGPIADALLSFLEGIAPQPTNGAPANPDGTTNTNDTAAMLKWLQTLPNRPGYAPTPQPQSSAEVGVQAAPAPQVGVRGEDPVRKYLLDRAKAYDANRPATVPFWPDTHPYNAGLLNANQAGWKQAMETLAHYDQGQGAMLHGQGAVEQANVEKAKLDLLRDPEYMKTKAKNDYVAHNQGSADDPRFNDTFGFAPTIEQRVRGSLNLPDKAPTPASFDDAVGAYTAAGNTGPAPPDVQSALRAQYPGEVDARLGGKPIGFMENWVDPLISPKTFGLPDPREQRANQARRIFGKVNEAGNVGVAPTPFRRPERGPGVAPRSPTHDYSVKSFN